jgi:hypothetical protein
LADLESVELVSYPLDHRGRWRIDLPELVETLERTPRARAILAVHPANPTGSRLHPDDAERLSALAVERGLALIVDEVFLDYPHGAERIDSYAGDTRACTFVLSGLSKVALLPQHKLGWIVASGPGSDEALARLEVIADSYLSVSTAVQLAAPTILEQIEPLQRRLRERLMANLRVLDDAIAAAGASCAVRRLPSEGGWYALLEVPRTQSDEAWAEHFVRAARVIVHPGYLFDMPIEGVMVVSLLLDEPRFAEGVSRLLASVR